MPAHTLSAGAEARRGAALDAGQGLSSGTLVPSHLLGSFPLERAPGSLSSGPPQPASC